MVEKVGIRGLDELKKTFLALPAELGEKVVRGGLRAAAKPIRDEARANAPVLKKPDPRRKPGVVQKAISVRKSKQDKYGVYVGIKPLGAKQIKSFKQGGGKSSENPDDPFYWIFSEFGTVNMPADPFMRPAYESKKYEALKNFEDYAQKRTVKVAEKLARDKGMKK